MKGTDGLGLRRRARLLVACLLAAALTALAACGGESSSDAPPRRVVQVEQVKRDRWTYARARFNEMCAGCHTLEDAGADGPRIDLDRIGGIPEARARVVIAGGEPGMPEFRHTLSPREYEELVAYVSTVAKNKGGDDHWSWQIRLRGEGESWRPGDPRTDGPPLPPRQEGDRPEYDRSPPSRGE